MSGLAHSPGGTFIGISGDMGSTQAFKTYLASVVTIAVAVAAGCSDVGFQSLPNKACTDFNSAPDQECGPGPKGFDEYTVTFKTGQVDILFVNDNSGSMSPEQAKMADAFPNFLDSIDHLDYQIGMVTTDVKNQNGALLEFKDEQGVGSGEKILKPSTANRNSKFRGTIKRQETLVCEQSGYAADKCPADDERGIYAMNLALDRNEAGIMRPGAHLAIVALGDEDQRSGTKFNTTTQTWESAFRNYPLEENDLPETLVKRFASLYSSKSLSVHAVIIKPGDATCYQQQMVSLTNGNMLRGSYGYLYNILTIPQNHNLDDLGNIVTGSAVSICQDKYDYLTSLSIIGALTATNARTTRITMTCLPSPGEITVTSTPQVNYTIDEPTQSLVFSNLPIGINVTVKYICPKN